MKRRLLALLLSFILVLSLSACGKDNPSDLAEKPQEEQSERDKETPDQPDEPKDAETEETGDQEQKAPETGKQEEKPDEEIRVVEIGEVLVDQDGYKITLLDFEEEGNFGPMLTLEMTNNSDKATTFGQKDSSINGYMMDAVMARNLEPGETMTDTMSFMQESVDLAEIDDIKEIEWVFHLYDSQTMDEFFETKPLQFRTEDYDGEDYEIEDLGEVLFEYDGIAIAIAGAVDSDNGWLPLFHIENNSDTYINVSVADVKVNGEPMDGYFGAKVLPGKRAIEVVEFMTEDFQTIEIEDLQDIYLSFTIIDNDDWSDIATSDIVGVEYE